MNISEEDIALINNKYSQIIDVNKRIELLRLTDKSEISLPITKMLKTLLNENQKEPLLRYIVDLKRRAKYGIKFK